MGRSLQVATASSHLLVFQMWTVSGSSMPCFSAMSSRKSKKKRTAMGGGRLVLRIATKTSSTNFCSVPCRQWQKQVARSDIFDYIGCPGEGVELFFFAQQTLQAAASGIKASWVVGWLTSDSRINLQVKVDNH